MCGPLSWQVCLNVSDSSQWKTGRKGKLPSFPPSLWLCLYHSWPVDGDVNLLWLPSCFDVSLLTPSFSFPSICGTRWGKRGLTPCGGSCHQFLAPFEDHEIADPRRTISAFSLLTGEGLTRDYNVTGMSQSVWLSLWAYSHPVARRSQEGIIWSIKGHLSLYCHWPLYSSFISQFGRLAGQHTKLMPTQCIFNPAPCCICLSQWFTSSCFTHTHPAIHRVCVCVCVLPQWEEQFGSTEEG